jgi:hypothetical protein
LLTISYIGVPPGTPFPTFITYNQTSIVVQTSDSLGVNAFNFVVEATEPLTGLTNTDVSFSVVSANALVATSITLVSSSTINDQTYLVGDPAIYLAVPMYIKFPSYVAVQYFYQIVPPVAYASVVVDP